MPNLHHKGVPVEREQCPQPVPSKVTETREFSNEELQLLDSDMGRTIPTKYKIVIVGNASVGKTSVVEQFVNGKFNEEMAPTIGVEFTQRPFSFDGHNVSLYLWDTAGQEKFRAITSQYYRGAVGAIVMYDVTDRKSFADMDVWMDEIDRNTGGGINKIIVGNKIDDTGNRVVFRSEAQKLARQLQLPYMETSAKVDDGINNTFATLAWHIYNRLESVRRAEEAERQIESGYDDVDVWETVAIERPSGGKMSKKSCAC